MQFNQFRKSELGISSTSNAIRPASAVYQSQQPQIPEQDEYNSTQDIDQDYYNQLDQQNILMNNLNSIKKNSNNFNDNIQNQRNTYIPNINNDGVIVMKQIESMVNMNQGDNQQDFIYEDKEESVVFNANQNILQEENPLIASGNNSPNQRLLEQQKQQYYIGDIDNMNFPYPQKYQDKNEQQMYDNHNIQQQNQEQQYNEGSQQQNQGLKQSLNMQGQYQSKQTNQEQNVYLNEHLENQINRSQKLQPKRQSTNDQISQIQKSDSSINGKRPLSGGPTSTYQNGQINRQFSQQLSKEQLQQQLLQVQQQLHQQQQQLQQQNIQLQFQQQNQQQQIQQQEFQESQQQQQYSQTNDQLNLADMIDDVLIDLKVGLVQNAMKKFESIIQKAFLELGDEGFWKLFIKIVKKLNFISIDYLNQGDINSSMKILNKCDLWTQPSDFGYFPDMRALTLNHMGCNYRRQNDYKKAIFYCEQALKILLNANQRSYLGTTYLNLSALSSQIGQHKKGLQYARMALLESQHEFMQLVKNSNSHRKFQKQLNNEINNIQDKNNNNQNNNINENYDPQNINNNNNNVDDEEDLDYQNKINTLVISYHNIAAEEEYFQNYEEALIHYENSVNTAEEYLGLKSKITQHFKQEFTKFSQRYANYKVYSNTGLQNGIINAYQNQLLSNTDQFFVMQLPNGMFQMSGIKKNRASSANGKRILRKKSKKNKKKMMVISNINYPAGLKYGATPSPYLQNVFTGDNNYYQNQHENQNKGNTQHQNQFKNYLINEEENYSNNNSQQIQSYPFVPQHTIPISSSSKNLYAIDNSISLMNTTTQINNNVINMSMAATTNSETNQQLNTNSTKQLMRPLSAMYDNRYKNLSSTIKTITNPQKNSSLMQRNYQTQDQRVISPNRPKTHSQYQINNSPSDPRDNLRINQRSKLLQDQKNNQFSDQQNHQSQQKIVYSPLQQKSKIQMSIKKSLSPQQKQQMKGQKKKRQKYLRNISLKLNNNVDYSMPLTNLRGPVSHQNSLQLFSPGSTQIASFQMASPYPPGLNKANQIQNNQLNSQQKQYLFNKSQYYDQNTSSQRKLITFALSQQQSNQDPSQQQNEQVKFKTSRYSHHSGASEGQLLQNKVNQQQQNQNENFTKIQLLQNLKKKAQSDMENIEMKLKQEIQKVNVGSNEADLVTQDLLNQINPQDLQQIENFPNNQNGKQHSSHNPANSSNKPSFHYNYSTNPNIGSGHRKTPSLGSYNSSNQIQPTQSFSKKFTSDKFLIRNSKISQIAAGTQAKKENIPAQNINNQNSQLMSTQNISKLSGVTNLNQQNQQINNIQQNRIDSGSISTSNNNVFAQNQQTPQQQQYYTNTQGQINNNITNEQQQPYIQQLNINNMQNQLNSNPYQYNQYQNQQNNYQNQLRFNQNQQNINQNLFNQNLNNQNTNQNQNNFNNDQNSNNYLMDNYNSQKQIAQLPFTQTQQVIEILLENPRTMIKELRDPKEKQFEGALKFILNKQKFSLTAVFESDKLSGNQIEHFINVSDIFHSREQEYSQIRLLLISFCNEITKYIYVNQQQLCLSITFQPGQTIKNQNTSKNNQLNNKNENNQTNASHSNNQGINNAILFDKIPIKLDLKSIQREVDVVVKNCSESILLLCDDQANLNMQYQDNIQSPRSTDDDNIRPLVNAYLYPAYNEQEDIGRLDQSQDSIQPIILDPNILNDPNNYNELYKEYYIQNNNQQLKNEGYRSKNKPANKQHAYGGEEMIPEVEEADTFSQMKNSNTLNHPNSNRNNSTIQNGNQKKQFDQASGSMNKNFNSNMNNNNNDEEILDEVQDYDDDFDEDFEEAIHVYEKNKNEQNNISRPKSSYQKRVESSKSQKDNDQQNDKTKSTGESKYGFQNRELFKKKQQSNDHRLSQIENEFSISKEDDRFNDKKSDNFEFDVYDKDPTFSGVKHSGRFDDSVNQSLEQIVIAEMDNTKNSNKRQSVSKQSQSGSSKQQVVGKQQQWTSSEKQVTGNQQINNVNLKNSSSAHNQDNNNINKNIQGKDGKKYQTNEELIQDRLLRQTGNRRNTPPPKIVINNGFDNDDPYIAYDNVQINDFKQREEKQSKDEEAREEFEKLLLERDPLQLNFAATFIQKKYKNKKIKQKEEENENVKNKELEKKNIEQKVEEPPIDINDQNRDDFEKAATLIGLKYKMRRQKLEAEKQNKPQQEKKEANNQEQKKQQQQEVVLDGPIEEYEKIASLIGGAYRKKKQREQEKQVLPQKEKVEEQKIKEPQNTKKADEPPIVLDGPVEEYVDVANKIGAAFKLKKERMKKKQEEEEAKQRLQKESQENQINNNDQQKKRNSQQGMSLNSQINNSLSQQQNKRYSDTGLNTPVKVIDVGRQADGKKVPNKTAQLIENNSNSEDSDQDKSDNLDQNGNPIENQDSQQEGGSKGAPSNKQKNQSKKNSKVKANFKQSKRFLQKVEFII